MISHTTCDHPSTSGARAKCRRARAQGEVHTEEVGFSAPLWSLGPPPPPGATPRVLEKERNRGTTPRDRDKQCDMCGIERIEVRGIHRWNGTMIFVGERCMYYLDPQEEMAGVL